MKRIKQLCDAYRFQGFRPLKTLKGLFGDPVARIITLRRRGKKRFVGVVERFGGLSTTEERGWFGTSLAGICGFIWRWNCGEWNAAVAVP